jgi:polyisoprenoid-binding protein YceI
MTLHGVEKPVQGTVSTKKNGDKVEYTFNFKVLLSDYKINQRTYLGLKVGNEFDVEVKAIGKVVPL